MHVAWLDLWETPPVGRATLAEHTKCGFERPAFSAVRLASRPGLHIISVMKKTMLLLLMLWGTAIGMEQADFYVATDGADTHPGTLEKPFASIGRAQQAVRERVEIGLSGPLTVLIRGGRYELSEPLRFGPQDTGPGQHCITYAAAAGESVRLCGGTIIGGWKHDEGSLWSCPVSVSEGGKPLVRQLYADGRRLKRGVFPAEGLLRIAKASSDARTIEFDRDLPGDLVGTDAEVVIIHNWSIARGIIAGVEGRSITSATPLGWVGHHWTCPAPGKPAFIENAPGSLSKATQWRFDAKTRRVVYRAADGQAPATMQFVVPRLEQLLVIRGTAERTVNNLCFRGLVFEHSAWNLPQRGYAGIQAGYNGTKNEPGDELEYAMPVAVELAHARDCVFEHCRFLRIGASAVGLGVATFRNRLVGCEIGDVGGNGVHIGLPEGPIRTLDQDWSNPAEVPTGNEVSNCYVHHCAQENFGCVGVYAAFTEDTRIIHNHVAHMPYTGVSVGFRWDPSPSSQKNCLVEYNHIHDCMIRLADGGGIYTLGYQPGTILRGNHIHDIHRSEYAHGGAPNNGIFFDEGSLGFLVEGNVIHGTSGEAIRFNQNRPEGHVWRGNSFGSAPGAAGFPKDSAAHAGIEPLYESFFRPADNSR